MELDRIDTALLRVAEDRVLDLRRAVEECPIEDPRRTDLIRRLTQAELSLADRLTDLRKRRPQSR